MLTVCHCSDCQRQSGSAFGMSLAVRIQDFEILQGSLKYFERSSESERRVKCAFCPECGSRIYNAPERMAGAAINIKPGTLDDTSWLAPVAHVWTNSKQTWTVVPGGVTAFEGQP